LQFCEQIVLDVDKDALGARVLDVQKSDADYRVRLVEGAIGRYADVRPSSPARV
jgi:hypothetical protein